MAHKVENVYCLALDRNNLLSPASTVIFHIVYNNENVTLFLSTQAYSLKDQDRRTKIRLIHHGVNYTNVDKYGI